MVGVSAPTVNLSEFESKVMQLRDDIGMSWPNIARHTGARRAAVQEAYRDGVAKIAGAKPDADIKVEDGGEDAKAEEQRGALEGTKTPLDRGKITQLAEAAGLPPAAVRGLIKRMEARYRPPSDELEKITTQEIQDLIDDRISRGLGYLDDFAMAKATARDLAVAIGIMIDKRQLLRGEPTQILGKEERKSLEALAAALRQELGRRTMIVDATPVDDVMPGSDEPQQNRRFTWADETPDG